jgi:hypothetical protein
VQSNIGVNEKESENAKSDLNAMIYGEC